MRSKVLALQKSEENVVVFSQDALRTKILAVEETYFQQVVENMRLRQALYDLHNENCRLRRQFDTLERNYERTEHLLRSLQGQMVIFKKAIFKWFSLESGTQKNDDEKTITNLLKQIMLDEVDSE